MKDMDFGTAGVIGMLVAFPVAMLIFGELNETSGFAILIMALAIVMFLTRNTESDDEK